MNTPIIPIILCGGSGTRLWPLSREQHPKQLLSLVNNKTMLQETIDRCSVKQDMQNPLLVCNEDHRFLVAEQAQANGTKFAKILLEPKARNTAPAIALAAEYALKENKDACLVVLPSDQIIKDQHAFDEALVNAIDVAKTGKLVTFGIKPTHPETGYGYIKSQDAYQQGFEIEKFVEKPDKETATLYVESGEYFWNSGMFVFLASRYLQELKQHRPDIADAVSQACQDISSDRDFARVNESLFSNCAAESIDVAVMEKTEHAIVIPLDAEWSDVGSWSALWDVSEKDDDGNVVKGDVIVHNSHNNYIRAEHRLVSTVGLENIVIVETADAVVVANKDQSQDIKKVVDKLRFRSREELSTHQKVYRPWGNYESVDNGSRFQVKRISVKPGAELSLQKHFHRAEHWIVVTGTAEVTCGKEVFLLTENESTYIPLGEVHRLANPGKTDLELIEVQSGNYLGEDDIVRFEDNYGRQQAS